MDLKDYLSNNVSNQKESNDTMSFYNKFEEFSRLYAGLYDSIKPSELLVIGAFNIELLQPLIVPYV
jgi:hypothetical protein